MLNTKTIRMKYGDDICRRCINKEYQVRLIPEDCQYFLYARKCPCCGNVRHIVVGFRISGLRKMLLR